MGTPLKHTFDGRFELTASVADFVSYLHYDNKRPVVYGLQIKSVDGKSHTGLEIRVRLTSTAVAFSEELQEELPDIDSSAYDISAEIKLFPKMFSAIESNRSGEFEFELFENEQSIGVASVTTELYPMHFWKRGEGHFNDLLLLGAFSQPNDPAIQKILTKAGALKGTYSASDGSKFAPNTRGYQGGPEEVRAEAKAVYEALQSFGIRYSNPIANFNGIGQPIRTPSEIIETQAATCLDSAMLIASALEAINLNPVILTVPEHAFVGVWLKDGALDQPVDLFQNIGGYLHDSILIFETTTICNTENPVSFEDACTTNLSWLDPNYVNNPETNWIPRVALDVVLARSREYGIHPLPTIQRNSDGTVNVIQTSLPKIEFNFTGTAAAPLLSLREDNSPERLKIWKASLLDSSFNNPLLNRDRRRGSILRLAIPNGKLADLEDLLQTANSKLQLAPLAYEKDVYAGKFDQLPEAINEVVSERLVKKHSLSFVVPGQSPYAILRKLATASASSVQETGVNNLYMTFGSLTWDRDEKSPSAGQVTSPLFLLPVKLVNQGRDIFELSLDDSGEPAPNETLALALSKAGVNVPLLSNPETDDLGFDIKGLLEHVRTQVNSVHKKSNWIVNEDAFLGTFDFSNFHMWKDLNDNWQTLAKAPLVKHLIETDGTKGYVDTKASSKPISDEELDKELSRLPIESDAAQVKAVLKSLSGESFIIQGPPGTGKSQTITNLLARNLQEGKRVLFMSEKAAALGVVKSRLDEIGLGSYILDLHDKGTKPGNIRNQLLAALDAKQDVDKTGLDTAQGEYDTALRALAKYPDRLHAVNEKYRESVYSARDRLLEIPGTEILSLNRKFVNEVGRDAYEQLLIAFRELPDIGENAKTLTTNEWSFARVTTPNLDLARKDRIKANVKKLLMQLKAVEANSALRAILSKASKVGDLKGFDVLAGSNLPSPNDLSLARSAQGSLARRTLKTHIAELLGIAQNSPHYSAKLGKLNLGEMQQRLVDASNGGLFKGKKYKTTAEYFANFTTVPVDKDNVAAVFEEVRPLVELCNKIVELRPSVVGLDELASSDIYEISNLAAIQQRVFELETILQLTDVETNPRGRLLLDAVNAGAGRDLTLIAQLEVSFEELFSDLAVTDESLSTWAAGTPFGDKFIEMASKLSESVEFGELRSLTRWADVITIIQPLIKYEQNVAVEELLSGNVSYNDAPRALQRGYFKLLFEKLMDEQELVNFEGRSHDSKISQLGDALVNLREYNRGRIAADVLATRKFDGSSTVGITGALRAELTKQRKQLPVRKLMKQYWQTITQVTPVVAASPDSVARFLDIESAKFDLVVFDEASQIRVAAAIGALGRAAQAIIVGDTEQMPPTALFQASDDALPEGIIDENDQFSLNDQESILSMAGVSQIPSTMLTWHYRSNDELLIAFSNKYIYEGKLSSFPSPRIGQGKDEDRKLSLRYEPDLYVQGTKGVRLTGADGEDLSKIGNTNLGEAKRVVAEIQSRISKAGDNPVSIGVITMNEQQRALIEKLLDGLEDDLIRRARNSEIKGNEKDYLFVRALERVQGDERDVILLSMGFAPTEPGGKLSMTFGPLIKTRSERRLNVAVTRARKEMIVFSSFTPDQMTLTDASSKGMHLLKKFLILAEGPKKNAEEGNDSINISSTTMKTLRDRHRTDIAEALRAEGYNVVENLGLSNFRVDLAIASPEDPTRCLLGIMLDGDGWRSRNSTSDRDVLPSVVLKKSMKWPGIERIWLPIWLRDRQGELARIKQAVDAAITVEEMNQQAREDAARVSETVEMAAPDISITGMINIEDLLASGENSAPGSSVPDAKASKRTELGINVDDIPHYVTLQDKVMVQDKKLIDYLDHPEVNKLLLYLMDELTKTEGPVSEKRATVFVAKCFGFSTVQEAKRNYILSNIPKKEHDRDEEGFLYPKGIKVKDFKTWSKQGPGMGRVAAEISLVEMANAMAYICAKSGGMNSPELSKQASLAFGITKLTNAIEARMIEAEKLGVKLGVLQDSGGILSAK